ncbi:MAG: glycosyltransferase family 4 protein [Desulfobulbaceae bacterium]|nr:glycosyltransferase family 4 protein [Desulfobulbaceae bacterium]
MRKTQRSDIYPTSRTRGQAFDQFNSLIGVPPGIVEVIKKHDVPAERMTMPPNGCGLDFFSAEVEAWRPAEIVDTDLMAAFAGTHGLANGLDVATVLKQCGRSDIKLLLIGNSKLKPNPARAGQQGRPDNVIFRDLGNKICLAGLMQSTDIGM